MEDIILKFTGDLAEQHQLPAYEGASSLEGMARTMTLVSHYLATGEIRKRSPFALEGRVLLQATQPGSFESLFQIASNPELIAAVFGFGGSVAGNFVTDTIKYLCNKLIGGDVTPDNGFIEELETKRGGELDALSDAIEPALKKGHTAIGNGATNIFVISGHGNIVRLDSGSKQYISEINSDPIPKTKFVSVGMLNVNTAYGRVYDYELGKTVPFQITEQATTRTRAKLASSLEKYASRKDNSGVFIKYREDKDLYGRVKRYHIEDAWFEVDSTTSIQL